MTKLNVKQRTKQGQCRAMRCKSIDLGEGFCEKHSEQAREQGLTRQVTVQDDKVYAGGTEIGTVAEVHVSGAQLPLSLSKDPVEAAGLVAGIEAVETPLPAVIAPSPSVEIEVAEYQGSISEYLDGIDQLMIASDEDMAYANDLLSYVKAQHKTLEERRKTVSKPLNDVLKTYNAWFKPALTALKNAETLLKQKIADATAAARKAQDEALTAIAESGGDTSAEVLSVAHGRDVVHTPDNVSIREMWDCEVTDPDLVPRAFCDPNPQRLLAYVNTFGAQAEVAGVKFFKKQIVTQRAK